MSRLLELERNQIMEYPLPMEEVAMFKYAAVTNIPPFFSTADLRAHFSALVESQAFVCFHYRHRPQKKGSLSFKSTNADSNHKTSNNSQPTENENKEEIKNHPDSTPAQHSDETEVQEADFSAHSLLNYCCCIVKILQDYVPSLLRYNGQNWTDKLDEVYGETCEISLIPVCGRGESSTKSSVDEEMLTKMPELRPPELMPQGNVGTPTLVFLDLIQKCLLPQTLIKKLDLRFPKTSSKHLYDRVNFQYQTPRLSYHKRYESGRERNTSKKLLQSSDATSSNIQSSEHPKSCDSSPFRVENNVCDKPSSVCFGSEVDRPIAITVPIRKDEVKSTGQIAASSNQEEEKLTNRQRKAQQKLDRSLTRRLMAEGIEERLIEVEKGWQEATETAAEEWDRHEASEDDPSNQERNKERLYEEEIEQPWEKGGPGVVFYTDAMFWQQKEGDFDEQTTDDLDVDFSAYEEGLHASDMDMKDFIKVRQEQRFRSGYDSTDRFSIGIGRKIPSSLSPSSSKSSSLQSPASSTSMPPSSVPSSNLSKGKQRLGQFERHSKGIGRKVMESQGWREGQGLGSSQQGMVDALRGDGQPPHSKRGIGFVEPEVTHYGVKEIKVPRISTADGQPVSSNFKLTSKHKISTVYDHPTLSDPKEPLLQRNEPTTLKHRQQFIDSFKNKK